MHHKFFVETLCSSVQIKRTLPHSIYIGHKGYFSLTKDRENLRNFPSGFATIQSHFDGACFYTGDNAGEQQANKLHHELAHGETTGRALCNTQRSQLWLKPDMSLTFICGRVVGLCPKSAKNKTWVSVFVATDIQPTKSPSLAPTLSPTRSPSLTPTLSPTNAPTCML